ncbi:MAG: hypothetical protein M3507_08915 [Actinomycetota bacterium]|nr:hypothetical protein [Actinomycetota bacterium]
MTTQAESVEESVDRAGPGGGDERGGGGRRGWSRGHIVALVAALAALAAVFLATRGGEVEQLPQSDDVADEVLEADPLTGIPEDYRQYRDEATGFTLAHPETWVPIARPEKDMRLVLSAGADSSLLVRYNLNDEAVDTSADLEKVRAFTDLVAEGTEGAQVVKRQAFNLHGINGISYLSRYTNEETGRPLVNAHYFLFQGRKMFTVLFQIVPFPPVEPEDDFTRLLPDINAVLDSFTIEPGEAPPVPVG